MLQAGKTFDEELDWTFYCVLSRPGRFDEMARALGARVVNSPVELREKVKFIRHLRGALRKGRYDVLHCHHDIVSAIYLVAALGLPIQRRIVHVHNADLHVPTGSARKAAFLREPMRRLCLWLADRIVGISRYTLATFLRGRPPRTPRDVVLYYGIDTAPFHLGLPDARSLRRSLELPDQAKILLFVGRMVSYKNPVFLLDLLDAIAEDEPDAFAVFVGAGPLEDELRARAGSRGLTDRVRILGWRDDSIALMRSSDLFVFPRLEGESPDLGREGLGLVVVEAQAAGLPSLLSHGIPEDAIVVPELCDVLPLGAGVHAWGSGARSILSRSKPNAASSLAAIESSSFSLAAGFHNLIALYTL